MSSKSKAQRTNGSSPYGDSSRRGRGGMLVLTVVVLLLAAGAWVTSYTHSIGESTQDLSKPSADPSARAVDQKPDGNTTTVQNH